MASDLRFYCEQGGEVSLLRATLVEAEGEKRA
jgi:hypothetical protein